MQGKHQLVAHTGVSVLSLVLLMTNFCGQKIVHRQAGCVQTPTQQHSQYGSASAPSRSETSSMILPLVWSSVCIRAMLAMLATM
jgi:hypothetical protein